MTTNKSAFGTFKNENILLFTLKNDNNISVTITNYGATITSIIVPNKTGKLQNIACGFDTLDGYFSKEYIDNSPYFGCTVGRYCSQIKDSKFTLNGKTYQLAENCGDNNLHGGVEGFDKKVWNAEILNDSAIKMSLVSKDLEEGFPGNVDVSVTFSLNNNNELSIDYLATPDADTPLSLTNHTYFNLSGFEESVENHLVKINTNKRLAMDDTGASTGEVLNIAGKVDDLQIEKRIGDVHEAMGDGFEHFYVFDNPEEHLKHVASVSNKNKDLTLDVSTTEPCMLLYTGKYTSDDLKRESGEQYGKYRGFCCETHRYQNGPNIPNSPKSITKAGETFTSKTVFKFS